jgi:hypothetical protein
MNDIFSLPRFGLLLKKFYKEHISTYLLYIAILFGIALLIYGLTILAVLNGRFPEDAPVIYFVLGIVFMASLFSSSFYSFFNNKAKGIQYLNLPSSHTEKLMIGFLFTQVVFFIIYIAVFVLVDWMMIGLFNHLTKIPADAPAQYRSFYIAQPINLNNPEIINGLSIAFLVSALSHFGSLCFEKNSFVKTALLTIIGGAVYLFYGYYLIKAMIPEEVMPSSNMFFMTQMRVGADDLPRGIVFLPDGLTHLLRWLLPITIYVLFWVASYFKFKEKQV